MKRRNYGGKAETVVLSDGNEIRVRSGAEAKVARQLDALGVGVEHETERLAYVKQHEYIPDFTLPNGILVEVKGWTPGWASGADRAKLLLIMEQHPEIDLRIVWSSTRFANGLIRSGAKTTNNEWAARQGIPTAVGTVPVEWLEE